MLQIHRGKNSFTEAVGEHLAILHDSYINNPFKFRPNTGASSNVDLLIGEQVGHAN